MDVRDLRLLKAGSKCVKTPADIAWYLSHVSEDARCKVLEACDRALHTQVSLSWRHLLQRLQVTPYVVARASNTNALTGRPTLRINSWHTFSPREFAAMPKPETTVSLRLCTVDSVPEDVKALVFLFCSQMTTMAAAMVTPAPQTEVQTEPGFQVTACIEVEKVAIADNVLYISGVMLPPTIVGTPVGAPLTPLCPYLL